MMKYQEALDMVVSQPIGTYAVCKQGAVWVKISHNWWLRHSADGGASNPMYDSDLARCFEEEGGDIRLRCQWMMS